VDRRAGAEASSAVAAEHGHDAQLVARHDEVASAVGVEVARLQVAVGLAADLDRLAGPGEAAVAVAAHERQPVLPPVVEDEIEVPVAVGVARVDRVGMGHAVDPHGRPARRPKSALAVAEEDHQLRGLVVGDGEVGRPVAVEIGRDHLGRVRTGRDARAGAEPSSAVAEEERHVAGSVSADGDVEAAVAVEVGGRDRRGLAPRAERHDPRVSEGRGGRTGRERQRRARAQREGGAAERPHRPSRKTEA
jgi:hypothetical protein